YRWQGRSGDFRGAAEQTSHLVAVASRIGDPVADALAHAVTAITSFHTGDIREVADHARLARSGPVRSTRLDSSIFGHVSRVSVASVLAHAQWLMGHSEQAVETATETLDEATSLGDPVTRCYVISETLPVYIRSGHLMTAEEIIRGISSIANRHSLMAYMPV